MSDITEVNQKLDRIICMLGNRPVNEQMKLLTNDDIAKIKRVISQKIKPCSMSATEIAQEAGINPSRRNVSEIGIFISSSDIRHEKRRSGSKGRFYTFK